MLEENNKNSFWFYAVKFIEFSLVLAIGVYVMKELTMDTKDFYNLELKKTIAETELAKKCCGPENTPPFSLGTEYLGIPFTEDEAKLHAEIRKLAESQLDKPETLMKVKDDPKLLEAIKLNDAGFFEFPSVLDNTKTARFKYDAESEGSAGRKVALIYVMHWNGSFDFYNKTVSYTRNLLLPISTLIHIPAARGLNPGEDSPADYESVSANIGKTIFRTQEDAQDIELMAKYLKEELKYEEVGLFTYSIGSLRGILASLGEPGLFDFAVFHMVADDFTDAVMDGIGTEDIAREIKNNINRDLLYSLWAIISPGRYVEHFKNLPAKTRIVQAHYDFVFGFKNIEDFNSMLQKKRPDIELTEEQVGHSTFGRFPMSLKVLLQDVAFIYKNTKMREESKSKFFTLFSK